MISGDDIQGEIPVQAYFPADVTPMAVNWYLGQNNNLIVLAATDNNNNAAGGVNFIGNLSDIGLSNTNPKVMGDVPIYAAYMREKNPVINNAKYKVRKL